MIKIIFAAVMLFGVNGFSKVTKETAVVVGYTNTETFVLREHKIKNISGYSILRYDNETLKNYKVLTNTEYNAQLTELKSILDNKFKLKSVSDFCSDPVLLIEKGQPEKFCFSDASKDRKIRLSMWWKKARKAAY